MNYKETEPGIIDVPTISTVSNELIKPKSIFRKRDITEIENSEVEKSKQNISTCVILDSHDLNNMIPESATPLKRNVIPNDTIEWRWRFFNINNRKLIEISYLNSNNNKRIYTDYTGDKTEYDIDSKWDIYLTKVLYAYAKI